MTTSAQALEEIEAMEREASGVWTTPHAVHKRAVALARAGWAQVERLTAEIEKLRDGRMVKVPAPDGMPDGIECRDDTIKLLESSARATEEGTQRLRGALRDILAIEYPAAKDVGHPTEVTALVARYHVIARAVLGDQT